MYTHMYTLSNTQPSGEVDQFMDTFLGALRVEAIVFTECGLIFHVMCLQLGGVPNPVGSKVGKFFWGVWMLLVFEQWLATFMAALTTIMAYVSFESHFRNVGQ